MALSNVSATGLSLAADYGIASLNARTIRPPSRWRVAVDSARCEKPGARPGFHETSRDPRAAPRGVRDSRSVTRDELGAAAAIDPDRVAAPAPVLALVAARVAELARNRHAARAERQAADVATAILRLAAHGLRVAVVARRAVARRITAAAEREAPAAAVRHPDAVAVGAPRAALDAGR